MRTIFAFLLISCMGVVAILNMAKADSVTFGNGLKDLGDISPKDYSGQAGKAVIVNDTEDGVTFGTVAGGSQETFAAVSSYVRDGTAVLNNVSSTWTAQDGHSIIVDETITTPGFNLELVYTGITNFNSIVLKEWYDGSLQDVLDVDCYDYTLGEWETYNAIINGSGYEWKQTSVVDSANHIQNGKVRIRIYHPTVGKNNHVLYVDYAKLSSLSGGQNLSAYATKAALTNVSGIAAAALPKSGGTMTGSIHFGGYSTFDFIGPTGTAMPSHKLNKSFLLNVTGRCVYYMCDGSSFKPTHSLGGITMYVDGVNGTDSSEKGFATGSDAFKSFTYAMSQVPGTYDGQVLIYDCSTGNTPTVYREQVPTNGKFPTGDFKIRLIGRWITMRGNQTATSGTARTSATASASVRRLLSNYTTNKYQGKMFYCYSGLGAGAYRPILSNTTSTIYVEAGLTSSAGFDSTSKYRIYDWGTRITGSDAGADTTAVRDYAIDASGNVIIENMRLDYCVQAGANVGVMTGNNPAASTSSPTSFVNCDIAHNKWGVYANQANYCIFNSYIHDNTAYGVLTTNTYASLYDNWLYNNPRGVSCSAGGMMTMQRNRFDTSSIAAVTLASGVYGVFSSQKNSVVNSTTGVSITLGGIHAGVPGNLFFNGNTKDVDAYIAGWSSGFAGTATLSSGSVTVTNANVTANSLILVTSMPGGASQGWLRVSAISAGTSFTITSSNVSDNSPVSWMILTQ